VVCGSVVPLAALLLLPNPLLSQASLATWDQLVLSTPGLGVGNAIIELRGGGFAAVGYADAGGATGTDVLLVRFDAAGDTLWTHSYGGDREDFGWDLVESPESGFFIVGYTEATSPGQEDVLVLRVDSLGALLWERTFDEGGRDRAWSAALAAGGGIVLAAESEDVERGYRDALVMHVRADGEPQWTRTIQEPGDQRVYSVARTEDGAFVVTGTTGTDARRAHRNVYVARVNADGHVEWTRSFGDASDDVGHGVIALTGGDVLVTGYGGTRSNGGTDIYLLRLDRRGDLIWWHHHGGPENERAMMSASRKSGGFVSVGFSMQPSPMDVIVWESDASGAVLSEDRLHHGGGDRGVMILETRDGPYALVGMLGHSRSRTGNFSVLWQRP
jgi:hypothetical protein